MADDLTKGYYSLSNQTNKATPTDDSDAIVSELLPELELSMKDEELIDLKRDWMKAYEDYSKDIGKKQTDNENYWLGEQFATTKGEKPLVDNLMFESLETFLPIATRPKPDPIVESDNTENGNAVADKVRKMLTYLTDSLSYNLKLKQVVRYWALYHLGVMKVGWSMKENDVTCMAVRPQKLIMDPNAYIEDCEYTGYYIGEYLEDMASDLVARFPKKEKFITEKVHNKMGTTLQYILWTTDEYVFWTLEDEVLAKNKNPHWNYEQEQPGQMDEMGQMGQPQKVPGNNHFKNPKKPYIFLSYFNLGKHPHDDTNLIQQNIPLQDSINKRLAQMDKNADNANGGLAVSGDAFTEEQAAKAAKAKRAGGVIWVPTGPVANAVVELNGAQLPPFVYQTLVDYRNELRNIFGTRGSTPQGTMGEKTVRGKMMTQQQDTSRIGGISSIIEEFSGAYMNWLTQFIYVYYDEPHYASVLGKEKAQEYIALSNKELGVKLTVGVKDGSMMPSDPVAKREEALQLWAEHALDPITFFERLDFPSPRDSAKNLFLWLSDPIQLFPDLAQAAAAQKKPAEKPPSVAINYKDLPPEGQVQAAAEANIHLSPIQVQQHAKQQEVQAVGQKLILQHQKQQHTLQAQAMAPKPAPAKKKV